MEIPGVEQNFNGYSPLKSSLKVDIPNITFGHNFFLEWKEFDSSKSNILRTLKRNQHLYICLLFAFIPRIILASKAFKEGKKNRNKILKFPVNI